MNDSRLRQCLQRTPILVGVFAPALLGLFWIACAAGIQSNYTIAHYTIGMAISNAADVGVTRLFEKGEGVWFVPTGAILSIASVGLSLGNIGLRWPCLVAALLLPFLFWGIGAVAFVLIAPFAIPLTLMGVADGETWGEGWVMFGTAGGWLWLWGPVFLIEFRRRHRLSRAPGVLCLLVAVAIFARLWWGPQASYTVEFDTSGESTTRTWGVLAYMTTTTPGGVAIHPWGLAGAIAVSLAVGVLAANALRSLLQPLNPPVGLSVNGTTLEV